MPRLFWKLFFALWLSIMTFAVVVSWINQSVALRNTVEQPANTFERNPDELIRRLGRDIGNKNERQVIKTLNKLPRGIRTHVFVLNAKGKEITGRGRQLSQHRKAGTVLATERVEAAKGQVYTVLVTRRPPPRALLSPGPRGVGMRLGVAAVVSALFSLLLARYLAAPLTLLSRNSQRLAAGDLGARVGAPLDHRRDEFGQLARDMDEMAASLQVSQQANQRLLRDVSHELRSPLARLRVALEIARNRKQSQVDGELDRIELESERLENLVDEVLGLLRESSGRQALQLEDFDLAELLRDLVETVDYEVVDGMSVDLQVEGEIGLSADREQVWRAFENLLRNALHHAGAGGEITIVAGPEADGDIHISVMDSGPGIPSPHLEHIFEPFYRVDETRDRRSGGHGLGLAIAASAIRRHGGRISAHNRESGGLEVRVVLPGIASGA
jgi:two-component system sensor histidine kinase CpxA